MQPSDLEHSQSHLLAGIMDLELDRVALWQPQELAAIWQHQLAAPLAFDFSFLDEEVTRCAETFTGASGPPLRTFGDLFAHPAPPVQLLEQTKRFAKQCRLRPDGPLPAEIATLLYVLSIVSARTKGDKQISGLGDEALRYSLHWSLAQPFLDARTRRWLEEGFQQVYGEPPERAGTAGGG